MEFPEIQEHLDDEIHEDRKARVLARLPEIISAKSWRGSNVEARRVYEAIVEEFGWEVLRREYLAALREMKKQGRVSFADLDDGSAMSFAP